MKNIFKIYRLILVSALLIAGNNLMLAQFCSSFGEGDFDDLCVSATAAAPNSGAMTSNTLDIYDASTGAAGADGTADVQLTLEAVVSAPCATGGDAADFLIEACIGSPSLPLPGPSSGSDFGASTSNDCACANGYICITIDFLNGFTTTAGGFDLAQSSNNGSSEGYEASFGYVTAATDADGNAITLPTINLANVATYCNSIYAAGTTISQHVGATGAGTYSTDDLNAVVNDCASSGQGGEDTGSGTAATNGVSAASASPNLGLNATDIITQVKHIYFFSNAPGSECDADGDTGVGTNPSGSWSEVDFCAPPLPCGFTADIALTEFCGVYDIEITNVMGQDPAQTSFDVEYSTDNGATFTAGSTGNAIGAGPFVENVDLTANGTDQVIIRLVDSGNTNCFNDFGAFTAPAAATPFITTFPGN